MKEVLLEFIVLLTGTKFRAVFGLEITTRNSVGHDNERIRLPVGTESALTRATQTKTTRRPQEKRNTFELCLQPMGLYYKTEDIPIGGMRSF